MVAAVTGAALAVAAAPGRAPEQDPAGRTAGAPDAAVTLLVGRALDEGTTASPHGARWRGSGTVCAPAGDSSG